MLWHSGLLLSLFTTPLVASKHVKGVHPTRLALYDPTPGSSPPKWKCLNSSQEIPFSAVNDDYCDCADGTDEPGTSACSNGVFHCINNGHVGADIKSSRVNDGLCEPECCDGSDEPSGICPDICGPIGEKHRAQVEAERKLRKTGSKIRSTYIAFAQKEKKRLEEAIAPLQQEIAAKRAEESRLRVIYEHAESLDAAMLNLRKESPTFHLLANHTSLLDTLSKREQKLRDRVHELEKVLEDLVAGYNPNYQDMAVLEAVRGWQALKPADDDDDEGSKEEEEESDWTEEKINELRNTDPLSALLEHEKHVKGDTDDDLSSLLFGFENYIPDGLLSTYNSVIDAVLGGLVTLGLASPEAVRSRSASDVEAARRAHQSALDALNSAESSLKSEQDALAKLFDQTNGYGRHGEWRKLKDTCIEKDTGEYTYSVCFFGSATQRPNSGGGSHSLGSFSSWNPSSSAVPGSLDYYSQQVYDHGERCWNGPERSAKLFLSCGTENTMLTVAEPEKCEYHFTGTSPALCWPDAELAEAEGGDQEALKVARIEL